MRPCSSRSHARGHRLARLAVLGALLASALAGAGPLGAAEFVERELTGPFRVIDGDTFDVDMNGDGEIQLPDERVRLLFVDTPELRESDKGMDLERGLQAKRLLAAALEAGPVRLATPMERPRGNYGRMLGLVTAGGRNVSLQLIRVGLSYFDTRFSYPSAYDRYAEAEGQAFSERLGIWSDDASRERYLSRLEREQKTPRADDNPRFGGSFEAAEFEPTRSLRRYVRVEGRLALVNGLNPRFVRIQLETAPGRQPVHGVAFHPDGERLGITRWPPGATVIVEGFVRGYRNRPNIIIHYGTVISTVALAE